MFNDTAKKNVWKLKSKMEQPKKVCNDTAKKNVCKPKSKMGQTKKVCNDTAKKNVWKPKSKMGQPKKVCLPIPQKRTYGSLKRKWDNRRKYVTTPQKRTYGSPKVKWDKRRKYVTTPQKRTYGSPKVKWDIRKNNSIRNTWSILQIPSPTSFSWQRISTLFCSRRVPIRCTMTCTTVTASVCSDSQSRWPEKSSQALIGQTTESLLSMIYKLRFQKDLQSLISINVKIKNFYLNGIVGDSSIETKNAMTMKEILEFLERAECFVLLKGWVKFQDIEIENVLEFLERKCWQILDWKKNAITMEERSEFLERAECFVLLKGWVKFQDIEIENVLEFLERKCWQILDWKKNAITMEERSEFLKRAECFVLLKGWVKFQDIEIGNVLEFLERNCWQFFDWKKCNGNGRNNGISTIFVVQ